MFEIELFDHLTVSIYKMIANHFWIYMLKQDLSLNNQQWLICHKTRPIQTKICPVGWGCRIHRLLLCRGVTPPNECPGYDTKQSDGEVPAMLELWGIRSTPSLPSLPGPLWPGVVAPDKCPIYGLNRTKPCFFHYTDFCI